MLNLEELESWLENKFKGTVNVISRDPQLKIVAFPIDNGTL